MDRILLSGSWITQNPVVDALSLSSASLHEISLLNSLSVWKGAVQPRSLPRGAA
jgi:hypothetical protein